MPGGASAQFRLENACLTSWNNSNARVHDRNKLSLGAYTQHMTERLQTLPQVAFDGASHVDVGKMLIYLLWSGVGIAFFKINFIEDNGPLAGCFGEEQTVARVSHVLIPSNDKVKIEKVRIKLQSATCLSDFAAVAEEYSVCHSRHRGGTIGGFLKGHLDSVFDVAFNEDYAIGKPHGPFEGRAGTHFLWIEERIEPKNACLVSFG